MLQENLNSLLGKNKELIKSLVHRVVPSGELEIVSTRSGNPTGLYRGIYIHSRYDPMREAKQLVDGLLEEEIDIVVFLGFALGYTVEACLEKKQGLKILVVEPDIGLFLKALRSRDMSHFLGREELLFAFGNRPDEILEIMEGLRAERIKIIRNRALYHKDIEYYRKIEDIINRYLRRKSINTNTMKRFGRIWIRNLMKNLYLLAKYPGITSLKDRFKGIPSLVIGAGPTLDLFLKELPELRKKMILIAVDTAMKPLAEAGISPDFMVIVDPQYWNTKYLERIKTTDSLFVAEPATHPRNFRLIDTRGFWIGSFFPLGKYFEEIIGEKGTLGAGGSVTTTAWDFARHIGSKEIFLLGVDLGFPRKQIHCKGTSLEELWHLGSCKLAPAETASFDSLMSGNPFYDISYNGESLVTDERMVIYKNWFESQTVIHRGIKTFNLSEFSLKIPGIEHANHKMLSVFPERRELIDRLLKDVEMLFDEATCIPSDEFFEKAFRNLLFELEELFSLAEKGEEYAGFLREELERGGDIRPVLESLEKVDQAIMKMHTRDIAGFLVQEISRKVTRGYNSSDPQMAVENSRLLYSSIKRAAYYHINLLKVMMKTDQY